MMRRFFNTSPSIPRTAAVSAIRFYSSADAPPPPRTTSLFNMAGKLCGAVVPFAAVWYGSNYLLTPFAAPELPDEFVLEKNKQQDHGLKAEVHTMQKNSLGGPFGKIVDCCTGKEVGHEEIFGGPRWSLLYFGFSKCAEVCPRNLNFLSRVVQSADKKLAEEGNSGKVQIVFVSVDPLRDSPDVLRKYLEQRVPSDVPWLGLCGSEEQVSNMARAWRVYYSTVGETEEEKAAREAKGMTLEQAMGSKSEQYQLDHSAAVYFIAPNGKLRDLFFDEMGVDHAVTRIDLHLSNIYGFDKEKEKE